MITANFWPFFNHLLTDDIEGYDATAALSFISPLLPALSRKTPSKFEEKLLNYLFDYIEAHRVAPSRMMFFSTLTSTSAAHPAEIQDLQEYSTKLQAGTILRFGLNDVSSLLDQYETGRDFHIFENTVQTAFEIYTAPTKVSGKELHGLTAAIDFTQRQIAGLGSSANTVDRHNLDEDGEGLYGQYLAEKADDLIAQRILTGMDEVDSVIGGFRPGELITLLGYVGDGKTTLAINWAYRAFLAGLHVVFITLEMPADTIKKLFHIRHSTHPKFKRHELLSTTKYTGYTMTPDEEEFMFRTVIPDFNRVNEDSSKGSIRILEPIESGFTYETLKAELLRLNAEQPINSFYLDYPNLMEVAPERGMDYDKAMSRLYVKLKTLCRTFNDGQRLVGFIPTQVNRAGREAAEKNNGLYTLRAISEYSEIEKSSDHVFFIYRDDTLNQAGECLIGHLKSRLRRRIDPFRAAFQGDTGLVDSIFKRVSEPSAGMLTSLPGEPGSLAVLNSIPMTGVLNL